MTHQVRAGGANRINDQLADLLERLVTINCPKRTEKAYKAPTFDGKGYVEYFALRFEEVSKAKSWNCGAALLHFREALQDEAQDCGRPTRYQTCLSLRKHVLGYILERPGGGSTL